MDINAFKNLGNFELYTVTEQVAERLKQVIVHGDINKGTKLPSENEMANMFQVSRQTIREALRLLSECHLIYSMPGRNGGHYVGDVTSDVIEYDSDDLTHITIPLRGYSLDEVVELRNLIEVKACYLAALRRTDEQLTKMEQCISFLVNEPLSDLIFYKSDFMFHKQIAYATQNRLIMMQYDTLSYTLAALFKHKKCHPTVKNRLIHELTDIYEAIKKKDAQEAAEKMKQHLIYFKEFIEDEVFHLS